MNRAELVARLAADQQELPLIDSTLAVKVILDAIRMALIQGERVEIRGFGSFGLNRRPARAAHNPKTGVRVTVPPKAVPHFKAGKELRERVDIKPCPAATMAAPSRTGCLVPRCCPWRSPPAVPAPRLVAVAAVSTMLALIMMVAAVTTLMAPV